MLAEGEENDAVDSQPAGVTRPTPRQGDNRQPLPRHTPGFTAISERKRADRWKAISLVTMAGAMALSYLTIKAGRATEYIHVMDPLGNMYAGPIEPLADSKRFFNVTSVYCTNAALQRSPAGTGFDLPEILKLYYSPNAIAKLQDDQRPRQDDFRRRNMQWKPVIDSVADPVAAGSGRIVEVRGRIVQAGAYANRTFYDEPAFTLVLTFGRNPDIGKAGAYPWICTDFDLKIAQ